MSSEQQQGQNNQVENESQGEAHHGQSRPELVNVEVDRRQVQVEAGNYLVSIFKQMVGVTADRLLDRVVGPGKFVQLQDTQHIHIAGGEVFVSYVKQGSSS